MQRRHFFRLGVEKALQTAIQWVDSRVERRAERWFRPPYALREMDFLLACTRCDRCINACPHQVLFPLPLERGAEVAGTPVMDLLTHGCHLCTDWPCVQVCEPGAMRLPVAGSGEKPALPRMATVTIDPARCLPFRGPECGACGSVCPVPGALRWEGPRPAVVPALCVGCALCLEACVTDPKSLLLKPLKSEADATTALIP